MNDCTKNHNKLIRDRYFAYSKTFISNTTLKLSTSISHILNMVFIDFLILGKDYLITLTIMIHAIMYLCTQVAVKSWDVECAMLVWAQEWPRPTSCKNCSTFAAWVHLQGTLHHHNMMRMPAGRSENILVYLMFENIIKF